LLYFTNQNQSYYSSFIIFVSPAFNFCLVLLLWANRKAVTLFSFLKSIKLLLPLKSEFSINLLFFYSLPEYRHWVAMIFHINSICFMHTDILYNSSSFADLRISGMMSYYFLAIFVILFSHFYKYLFIWKINKAYSPILKHLFFPVP
jgi:hypothetical protein